jgi:hypothetical protein
VIRIVIALGLFATPGEATLGPVDDEPDLTIDPCVGVDEAMVRELMTLEIRDARARKAALPTSVTVDCTDEGQRIRVEPWAAASASEGVRTIQLPIEDDAVPATRQARSRELVLAIAELVRRQQVAPPALPPPPPPPTPPPAPPAPVVVVAPPPPERPAGPWRVGILPAFDYFAGGQRLLGGDLLVGVHLGHWLLAELRGGGRMGVADALPGGSLTASALTMGAALGPAFRSSSRRVGAAVMLRAQEYLVWFRAVESGGGSERTAFLGAFTLAGEPRLMLALTSRFSLEVVAAVGYPVRGIVVRMRGTRTESMSGLLVSGNLAGVLTF